MSNNDKQAKPDNPAVKKSTANEPRQGIGGEDKVAGGSGPGSDNPALAESYAEEAGAISTADFLMARESAEEERLRQQQAKMYADQSRSLDHRQQRNDAGERAAWPAEGEQSPAEYADAPHADSSYLGGSGASGFGFDTIEFEGEVDAQADRMGAEAAKNQSPSGLGSPDTADPDADFYDRREYDQDNPPSDLDTFAPGMVYLPPDDSDKDKHGKK
jgi:hypothetical protein